MPKPATAQRVSRGLSIREFAELNGVCESTVKRAVREGRIPSYKISNLRRIPLSYLEQLQQDALRRTPTKPNGAQ